MQFSDWWLKNFHYWQVRQEILETLCSPINLYWNFWELDFHLEVNCVSVSAYFNITTNFPIYYKMNKTFKKAYATHLAKLQSSSLCSCLVRKRSRDGGFDTIILESGQHVPISKEDKYGLDCWFDYSNELQKVNKSSHTLPQKRYWKRAKYLFPTTIVVLTDMSKTWKTRMKSICQKNNKIPN